jgi:hypothetical protein
MIKINLDKAKAIAHTIRRSAREVEFKPLDDIIAKQIPGVSAVEAEASRQVIRQKYTVIQDKIDAAGSVDVLSNVVKEIKPN